MSDYLLGYAKVSTLDQDPALQHDALIKAGCQRIFVDKASGKLKSRPALDDLLEQARPGDSLVAWRLDRLDRLGRRLRGGNPRVLIRVLRLFGRGFEPPRLRPQRHKARYRSRNVGRARADPAAPRRPRRWRGWGTGPS